MPGALTEITEIVTALGMLRPDPLSAMARRPPELRNVNDDVWGRLVAAYRSDMASKAFDDAFANGSAFLHADDGLRGRPPLFVEWKGPHRPPGDDVVPADLRIDHVYQVSCKYLSRLVHNAGPARLFDRLLIGEDRSGGDCFAMMAPEEYQAFFDAVRTHVGGGLPDRVCELTKAHRVLLKEALRSRSLAAALVPAWADLGAAVASRSAARWTDQLGASRTERRLLWRLLRIADSTYFVLGSDGSSHLRLRVASAWDWVQAYELRSFTVSARPAGQPEVCWSACIRDRSSGAEVDVAGHVEIRWSHGRLQGSPEAKIYLDTPHAAVPGYYALT